MKNINRLFAFFLAITFLSGCGNDDEDPRTFEEQLAIDIDLIDDYLEQNSITSEIHSSGIRFVRTTQGEGDAPALGDNIVTKFTTHYLDGTFLGQDTIGSTVTLNAQFVEAWRLMLPEMQEGGSMTIYTPSGYAFGNRDFGNIPANSNLIYEVELIARVDDADEQLAVDTLIIDEYLQESNIPYEVDDSGIRFRRLTEGTGNSPTASDNVLVRYEGRFLSGGVFDQSTEGTAFSLLNLISAWQIMIPQMKTGGLIEIYVPSRFGYGTSGNQIVPPNAILVFEIELIDIGS